MKNCEHSWGLVYMNNDKTRQVKWCGQCYKYESLAIDVETDKMVWVDGIRYNEHEILQQHMPIYTDMMKELILEGKSYVEIMDNHMKFLEPLIIHDLYNKVSHNLGLSIKSILDGREKMVCDLCNKDIQDIDTVHTCKKDDGKYQDLCDDCWSKYTKDEGDETNLMKDNFDIFKDRAISLLERWERFRDNNKNEPNIITNCIEGFLTEINDDFTQSLVKHTKTKEEEERDNEIFEFRKKQSKEFSEGNPAQN